MSQLNRQYAYYDEPHPLLRWSDQRHRLGVEVMDGYHREFLDILSALALAPDGLFPALHKELMRHVAEHFGQEEILMRETSFPSQDEHAEEHKRIIGELSAMQSRAQSGRLAMPREFINTRMPEWFQLHLVTMDSALAGHLKVSLNLK